MLLISPPPKSSELDLLHTQFDCGSDEAIRDLAKSSTPAAPVPAFALMFPPLKLTLEQQTQYEAIAQELLDSTIKDYERFQSETPERKMSPKHWKAVKARENLTVYKERDPKPMQHCAAVGHDWVDPKLLVTMGTIVGDLDDAMYGQTAPDAASMLLKTSITENRMIGGATLAQINGPSIAHPFTFLGVKWTVIAPPTSFNGMVWSRDLLFVEATGIAKLPNGERIGYQLMKSIAIPGYGSIEHHSIVRGRVCSCLLFRQLENRTVDVYLKGYVEAFGKVTDSLALKTCARGFLSPWNSVGCSQYKKTMWCVAQRRRLTGETRRGTALTPVNPDRLSCGACAKKFRAFHSADMCILCDLMVCSRCRIQWKLREVDPRDLSLHEKVAIICKSCVASASKHDPVEIAKQEIRSGRFEVPATAKPVVKLWTFKGKGDAKDSDVSSVQEQDFPDRRPTVSLGSTAQPNPSSISGYTLSTESEPSLALSGGSSLSSVSSEELDFGRSLRDHHLLRNETRSETEDDLEGDEDEVCVGEQVDYDSTPNHSQGLTQKEQLWQQLLALQVANESIYQMTLQTAETHVRRSPSQ